MGEDLAQFLQEAKLRRQKVMDLDPSTPDGPDSILRANTLSLGEFTWHSLA